MRREPRWPRQEQPSPLQEHADPKAELRSKSDMDKSPGKPCDKSMQLHLTALENRIARANDRHVTFIELTKRLEPVLADNLPANQFSDVTSLLHRYLGNAR